MSQFRVKKESPNPKARIKNEAGRRIVEVVGPTWKQLNFLARASDLHIKETRGVISTKEANELQKILALWEWVKRVRVASDNLEALQPADYKKDHHWPAIPSN